MVLIFEVLLVFNFFVEVNLKSIAKFLKFKSMLRAHK